MHLHISSQHDQASIHNPGYFLQESSQLYYCFEYLMHPNSFPSINVSNAGWKLIVIFQWPFLY